MSDRNDRADNNVITNDDDRFSATDMPPAIAPRSWIELRYVKRNGNVYGPYRLRRWYEGGKLRSRYLGK